MLRISIAFILLSCSYVLCRPAWGQQHVFIVDTAVTSVDANVSPYDRVQPGDTLLFSAGERKLIRIENFAGEKDKPVIIMNHNGQVIINTDHYYGMSILNCRYIRLTGSGDVNHFYGFRISRVANGAGIGIGGLSSDYEIDHIRIENCLSAGIFAKTDPDCSLLTTRDKFTQYNTRIHDNYIGSVGTEGLYIGSTQYFGQTVNCNGVDTLLLPSLLEGVEVYKNIIEYSGWDGIQVSSASKDCHIYDNMVLFDSRKEYYGQMSGIIIGGGSKCDCNNNFISQGNGNGIEVYGLAGLKVFNNVIVDAGKNFLPTDKSRMVYGIFVTDITAQKDSAFNLLFNTIVNPKSDGIRFVSIVTKNNLIVSNLIVNPGNYDYYENGSTPFKGYDSYIMFPNSASDARVEHNFLTRTIEDARVSEGNFAPVAGSPLINAASPETLGIDFDFYHYPRPYGPLSDIGAYEYDPAHLGLPVETGEYLPELRLYPNPVKSLLTIRFKAERESGSRLDVYNLRGNYITGKNQHYIPGEDQKIELEVENLSAGIYLYILNSGGRSFSGRFIKIN